jgi:replicative DNA helicase
MLTEHFVNLCCTVLLDKHPKFTDVVISDILAILASYEEEDIALNFRKKFSLSKSILRLRMSDKDSEAILDSLVAGGHFLELDSFLKHLSSVSIPSEKVDAAINQICDKKQLIQLQRDLPSIEDFVAKFNNNAFTDTNETLDYWYELITSLHTNALEEKRKKSQATIKELDLFSDSYTDVLDQIELSHSGLNSVSTGFSELDTHLSGGFAPARLYIFGGCSGDGKSVLLNNLLINAVENNKDKTGPMSMFMYFTMENLIDESLVRLYCAIEDKDVKEVINNYAHEKLIIEQRLKDWQLEHNAIICASYFPPTLTAVSDLVAFSDRMVSKYEGKAVLRGTFTDYLDLLKAGRVFDLHRLEMGQITIDMKVAAVTQSVPWITVTQLNRGAYDPKENLSLSNMSESIKKVEHSDFVATIRNVPPDIPEGQQQVYTSNQNDFRITIGKNRNGPKDKIINLKSNFSKFKIYDNSRDIAPPIMNLDMIEGSIL